MNPLEVLEYRSPPAAGEGPRRWWWRFSFPLALVSSLIALAGSLLGSWVLWSEFSYRGPNAMASAVLTLFVVGVLLMFLLMVTSVVTIALACSDKHEPWRPCRVKGVALLQGVALLLPFAVILVFGNAV